MANQTTTDTMTEATPRPEPTSSGVKLNLTAKGLIQPEITVRYNSATEALERAVSDVFALYDQVAIEAHDRGLTLVTDLLSSER